MKFAGIVRFEVGYQLGRPWPWLSMAVLAAFAIGTTRIGIVPVTLPQDFVLNSPFIIASVTILACQIWLLVAPPIAGDAAARDVQTGLYPLIYTSSVSKLELLGGRFVAALLLNALILLGVQAGSLVAVYATGVHPDIVGPFPPEAYLAAYGLLALPNVLIGTTMQFTPALFAGRPMAAYLGSFGLFFVSYPVTMFVYMSRMARPQIALLSDPIGVFAIMNEMMSNWTLVEKNVRMFALEGHMLWNRVLWVTVALFVVAGAFAAFRLAQREVGDPLRRLRLRLTRKPKEPVEWVPPSVWVRPEVAPSFGAGNRVRQIASIAGSSFRSLAKSPAGLFLLVAFPAMVLLMLQIEAQQWGVPLLPRTAHILSRYLTAPITAFNDYWVIVPILIVYFAAELIWRERDAGLGESVDATPVPAAVLFFGKYLGLALLLGALMIVVSAAGIATQLISGYGPIEIAPYLQVMFGLQLPEYLLFAMLVFAIQAIVDHRYLGPLLAFVAYFLIVFAGFLGVEHHLLVYTAGPEWSLTDMRGYADSIGPWLWFKAYWALWAVLMGVAATLLWVRGWEDGLGKRLQMARRRLTRRSAAAIAIPAALVMLVGGFIFYNTNVLNGYLSADEQVRRRAEYERRYGMYDGTPQPERLATSLEIEVYPDRGDAAIRGSYLLVNREAVAIDTLHLEPAFYVDTAVSSDRPWEQLVGDDRLGHDIYALAEPLQPGDSMTVGFVVDFRNRGFGHGGLGRNGAGRAILPNGSYFDAGALPLIGYQKARELTNPDDRRREGLPRAVTLAAPSDIDPIEALGGAGRFDAVIGTAMDQVAVAPGRLRRSWTDGGRRYFHYASETPIGGRELFFSADYAVHRETWNGVEIQLFLHPEHTRHLDRMLRSARASLDLYSAEFGPYPYSFLQIVEQPGNFLGMGVDGSGVITTGEGTLLLDPEGDGVDVLFETMAHEVGHQWWGVQVTPAMAEGAGVISESLAWYSAMQVVRREKGRDALRQLMGWMRQPYPYPAIRTGLPLLRAMDPWTNYRKGPFVMTALAEYVGADRVNAALREFVRKHDSTLATTLDMYRELRAVTPDSLQPLLHDLFEQNTHWTFETLGASAVETESGEWQVTFDVEVRKTVVDSAGRETVLPVDEAVEIGVFASSADDRRALRPLYVQMHQLRSGRQTITVTVPERPSRGGVDPYNLLDWEEGDNIEEIAVGSG